MKPATSNTDGCLDSLMWGLIAFVIIIILIVFLGMSVPMMN